MQANETLYGSRFATDRALGYHIVGSLSVGPQHQVARVPKRKSDERPTRSDRGRTESAAEANPLRIIGGKFRGSKLLYSGDLRTRPMKDRVREAVFNLLGSDVEGKHAFDLFAGTGALGLESLSRGASRATFLEQHFPSAAIIRKNIEHLELAPRCEVVPGNTFIWTRRMPELDATPWLVFCSPPYAFYLERQAEMLELIRTFEVGSPPGSILVVECDERFDPALLPSSDAWDVRIYPPAVVAILRKP